MKPLFFKNVTKGVVVSLFCWAISLLIFCFCALKMSDPKKYLSLFANISLLLGALIGGRVAAKNADDKTIVGLLCGLFDMVLVLLVSLILGDWSGKSLLFASLTVLIAFIGAITSKNGDKKSPKIKKHRKNLAKKYGVYQK